MEPGPVLPVTLLTASTKPEGLPALGYMMAEDPGHKRSLCSQQQEGGGWGLEGPWWCFCSTEGASVKGAQHGSSGTHAVFVFSPDNIQGLCRGSQRNASSAPPLPPTNPQDPPPQHLHENRAMFLRLLWRNFQIHRSVIPFLWFRLKVEIHSGQSVSELLRMDGPS